jgi:hypothetical protein
LNTYNNGTTSERSHAQNGFHRGSSFHDPHPDRTAKVRLALAKAKGAPGTWQTTHCLAHDDEHPSGALMIDAKERLAAKCHSQGCKLDEIKVALGQRGLLEEPHIVATYRYEYEDGAHAFDVVRFVPKDFRQRRADGKWSMKGVRLVPFKLPALLAAPAHQWVLINEGEAGTLSAITLGFDATNSPGGAGKFRPGYAKYFKGRNVAWIVDHDQPGENHVRTGGRILHGIAAGQKFIRLPGIPFGGDIREWVEAGGTAEQLRELIDAAPLVSEKDFEPTEQQGTPTAVPYEGTPNGIIYYKPTDNGGSVPTKLSNFDCRILSDVQHDDGVESTRYFDIGITIGEWKRTAEIPAKEYPSFNWLPGKFGAKPSIRSGNGIKDRLREAVQLISNPVERLVLTHTGWVKTDSGSLYIHGGGAIGGSPEVEVALPPQLALFDIPAATRDEIIAGMRSSLGLLGLAPDHIMVPLVCCVYRAVLGDCDFGAHIHGHTGLFKSELAALALQHFGRGFSSRGMVSWTSTVNFIQMIAFHAKDAVLVVDDLFGPSVGIVEKQRQRLAVDRVFREKGNGSDRGRLNSDSTMKAARPSRCLPISTGEEALDGESLRSRVWDIPVTEDDTGRGRMDLARLTEAQRVARQGGLAHAMRGYIEYLTPKYERIHDGLRDRVSEYRSRAVAEIGVAHARTSTMVGDLLVGFETFLAAALEYGAISGAEADEYKSRVWSALIKGAEAQARSQANQEQAHRFIELLMAAVSAGKAFLAARNAPQTSEGEGSRRYMWRYGFSDNGLRVGWFDGDDVYLDPDTSYKAACEMSVNGSGISISLDTLKRRLKDQRLLASTDTKRQTTCIRRSIEGRQRDVLHFRSSTLGVTVPNMEADEFMEKY